VLIRKARVFYTRHYFLDDDDINKANKDETGKKWKTEANALNHLPQCSPGVLGP
jgi:hypothetical protein